LLSLNKFQIRLHNARVLTEMHLESSPCTNYAKQISFFEVPIDFVLLQLLYFAAVWFSVQN